MTFVNKEMYLINMWKVFNKVSDIIYVLACSIKQGYADEIIHKHLSVQDLLLVKDINSSNS